MEIEYITNPKLEKKRNKKVILHGKFDEIKRIEKNIFKKLKNYIKTMFKIRKTGE